MLTSCAIFTADENQTAIGTVSATDADNLDTSASTNFVVIGSDMSVSS